MPKYTEKATDRVQRVAIDANNISEEVLSFVKSKIFDVIAIGIILAMIALTLGVFEKRDLTWEEFGEILLECIPFYLAAMVLSMNYYTKGAFKGKASEIYNFAITEYSDTISMFTGDILTYLTKFCDEYNSKELIRHQTLILKGASIDYDLYSKGDPKNDIVPMCQLTYKQAKAKYGKTCANAIRKANNVKIKGISDNKLLGNLNTTDNTDVGKTETELRGQHALSYAIGFAIAIFFISLLTVKNILEWGWISLIFIAFKLLYVVFRAYMRYFDGYNDITIHMVNHYNRKSDILKQCVSSYNAMTAVVKN